VRPEVYPERSGQTPAQWLASRLGERLGRVDSYDHGQTFSAAGEVVREQRTLTAAGHAYGFSGVELAEAARLLGVG
jgi:hypothetical protein